MLATVEGGRIPEQARLIPKFPPDLPARDRGKFIETVYRVLFNYPVITAAEARRRGILRGFDYHAISIPTTSGNVYPEFQFKGNRLHWRVEHASWYLWGWKRADWWTSPNEHFDDKATPASLLGTAREYSELEEAIKALYPRNSERMSYEE